MKYAKWQHQQQCAWSGAGISYAKNGAKISYAKNGAGISYVKNGAEISYVKNGAGISYAKNGAEISYAKNGAEILYAKNGAGISYAKNGAGISYQPQSNRSTVGDRAFLVAGPQVWNSLPPEVRSAPSLDTFRRHLKTHLFTVSYSIIQLS